jgi:hypothetical protein
MNRSETTFLYDQHAYDSPVVDDWIDGQYADIDTVRAFGPIAEMRGVFTHSPSQRAYQYTFTPDQNGKYRAICMPLYESGLMVDIAAWRADQGNKRLDVWGTVTGQAKFLNHDAIYATSRKSPLRVHETWWQWLVQGCIGVFALRNAAYPLLRDAGDIVVNDSAHALQLQRMGIPGRPADMETARVEGRKRVWIRRRRGRGVRNLAGGQRTPSPGWEAFLSANLVLLKHSLPVKASPFIYRDPATIPRRETLYAGHYSRRFRSA